MSNFRVFFPWICTWNCSHQQLFSAQNAPNIAWRPGSARTRWGNLQRSPDPLAGLKGLLLRWGEGNGTGRKGRRGGEREGLGEKAGEGPMSLSPSPPEMISCVRPWCKCNVKEVQVLSAVCKKYFKETIAYKMSQWSTSLYDSIKITLDVQKGCQWAFKIVRWWAPPDRIRQSVPSTRTGHGKGVEAQCIERRVAGTVKSVEEAERWRRHGSVFSTGRMTSCRYLGADPCTQLKTSTQSLYWMRPQPVQVGEQRRDVVVKLCPDCETFGGINDRLQSVQFTARQRRRCSNPVWT